MCNAEISAALSEKCEECGKIQALNKEMAEAIVRREKALEHKEAGGASSVVAW